MSTEVLALKARMKLSGELSIKLRGNCMEPLIKAGDMAKIIPATKAEVGRVYLLELPNSVIALHRIIAICDENIISKGDYSSMYEVLPKENIIGILIAVKLNGTGSWLEFKEHNVLRRIGVILSKRSIYDKRLGKESHLHRAIRLGCKKTLVSLSRYKRRRWVSIQ
jgi:hypothetical protein